MYIHQRYFNYRKILFFSLLFLFWTFFVLHGYLNDTDEFFYKNFLGSIDSKFFVYVNIFTQAFAVKWAIVLTAILSFIIYKRTNYKYAILLIITVLLSALANELIKNIIQKARPIYKLVSESGYSYPSGHSNAAATLLILFSLLYNEYKYNLKERIIYLICAFLTLLIMFSRIYLGVHFFSDCIGGLILGIIFVEIANNIYKFIKN